MKKIIINEKEIRDWYNQRHCSLGKNAWRPYDAYPIFLDYLNITSAKRLLDIGCGTGYLLKAADQRGLGTYGLDISDEGVKIARKISPNSKIILGKGEDLKFPDNFFDYVTCVGSLEHFCDMEKGINEMLRVAKKGAIFCVVVPNINFLFWKIRGTRGTGQQDINENPLSLKQWKNIFLKRRLQILKIYQDKWFMKKINIFSPMNPLQVIKKTISKLIWIFLPLNLTCQFVFILRKG